MFLDSSELWKNYARKYKFLGISKDFHSEILVKLTLENVYILYTFNDGKCV